MMMIIMIVQAVILESFREKTQIMIRIQMIMIMKEMLIKIQSG